MGSPTALSRTPAGSTSRSALIVATYCAMMSSVAAPVQERRRASERAMRTGHARKVVMLTWFLGFCKQQILWEIDAKSVVIGHVSHAAVIVTLPVLPCRSRILHPVAFWQALFMKLPRAAN